MKSCAGLILTGMSKSRRGLVATTVVAIVLLVAACSGPDASKDVIVLTTYTGQAEVGDEFTLSDIVSTGQPMVLNFWGGSCPPCEAEMPVLQKLWDAQQENVIVVGVDVGRYKDLGDSDDARRLIAKLGITYPTAFASDAKIVGDWGVESMPSTYFVLPDGKVQSKWLGAITSARLSDRVRDLLAASAGSTPVSK